MSDSLRNALTYRSLAWAALRGDRGQASGPASAEADIRHEPWWRVRTLRRTALRAGVSTGGLLALALVTFNAHPWWSAAWSLATGPTAPAEATVREVKGALVPALLPDHVVVTFRTAAGDRVTTAVAWSGDPPAPGSALTVEYAAGSPGHAAAASSHALAWGVADSLLLAALCLARIGWCAVRSARTIRLLVAAARAPEAHPVRYVRLHDRTGDVVWLLLFPLPGGPDDRPSLLLPVHSGDYAPVGTADLRGDPADGGVAVPWIDGRAVWPLGESGTFRPSDEAFVFSLAIGALDTEDPEDRPHPLA